MVLIRVFFAFLLFSSVAFALGQTLSEDEAEFLRLENERDYVGMAKLLAQKDEMFRDAYSNTEMHPLFIAVDLDDPKLLNYLCKTGRFYSYFETGDSSHYPVLRFAIGRDSPQSVKVIVDSFPNEIDAALESENVRYQDTPNGVEILNILAKSGYDFSKILHSEGYRGGGLDPNSGYTLLTKWIEDGKYQLASFLVDRGY